MKRFLRIRPQSLIALVVSVPAIYLVGLLFYTMFMRWGYPYDLEWMEGNILLQTERLAEGSSIYPEPSVEFIPFLYTPLYPMVLASFSAFGDISYQLGRLISIVSLMLLMLMIRYDLRWRISHEERPLADLGWVSGLAILSVAYPYMDGWYDLVRADTLFCLLAFGGLILIRRWATARHYERGPTRMFLASSLIALSFYCKQTGFMFVASGGLLLLFFNYRRLPMYIIITGTIGLGGTVLINALTDGWFWTYVYEVHQAHDFSMDRFWASFEHIVFHIPVPAFIIGITLVFSIATSFTYRRTKQAQRTFFTWTAIYVFTVVLGAIGWGTQYAEFNAYMPSFIGMAGCIGASMACLYQTSRYWRIWVERSHLWRLPVYATIGVVVTIVTLLVVDAVRDTHLVAVDNKFLWLLIVSAIVGTLLPALIQWSARLPRDVTRQVPLALSFFAAVALAIGFLTKTWNPDRFIPNDQQRRAGKQLTTLLSQYKGEVWIPYHNWYARKMGKPTFSHRMGLIDMTNPPTPTHRGRSWEILELDTHLREQRFAAIVLNKPPGAEFGKLRCYYRQVQTIPKSAQPRTVTGYKTQPRLIFEPIPKESLRASRACPGRSE